MIVCNKLLVLKTSVDSGPLLRELWSVELELPDEIEQLRQSRRRATMVVKQLTLAAEVVCATSVRCGCKGCRLPCAGLLQGA